MNVKIKFKCFKESIYRSFIDFFLFFQNSMNVRFGFERFENLA